MKVEFIGPVHIGGNRRRDYSPTGDISLFSHVDLFLFSLFVPLIRIPLPYSRTGLQLSGPMLDPLDPRLRSEDRRSAETCRIGQQPL